MEIEILVKAVFAGLVFGLPAGPAGLVVLRAWLMKERAGRWGATLGMAAADGLVAATSLWGLIVLPPLWRDAFQALRPVAGAVLIGTGLGFLFFEKDEKNPGRGRGFWSSAFWPAGLVLTNPGIWAAYTAFLLALGAAPKSSGGALLAGSGAAIGVCLLWNALGSLILNWRRRGAVEEEVIVLWSDRTAGLVLIGFGVWGLFF